VYYGDYDDFKTYLHDLADDIFPFPGYHRYQDEILYETLEAYLVDDYLNVVVEGPTGIGKSAINVTVGQVLGQIAANKEEIESHFGISLRHLNDGSAFYTTPQRSLRNQLAEDEDLEEAVKMLKARADYTCGVSGENCAECPVNNDSEDSCRSQGPACTYWTNKMDTCENHIAVLTFAMLIVDHYLPASDDAGRLSFEDRDLVVVDEGHGVEEQSASLFAGFDLGPWSLPKKVWGNADQRLDYEDERLGDVEDVIRDVLVRTSKFIENNSENADKANEVERCENLMRKMQYALRTHEEGEGWVVNVEAVGQDNSGKKLEIKPVRVDKFLKKFIWSRGRRRLITSATIPFRNNIGRWADRLGLDEGVKFISKPTPFPVEHRQIHLNTMVGKMDSDNEDGNWNDAVEKVVEIYGHHKGEKGLIHSVSYPRAKRLYNDLKRRLGDDAVILDEKKYDTDAMITKWQNSDAEIFISPAATEGVDLYEDKCRWQVLLKVPFAYMGDSRVNYLVFEENEWSWYYENATIDIIQSVGRAVRGPEPSEAASYYVLDSKFTSVMNRTSPPDYFMDAVTFEAPDHWEDSNVAPWR